MVDRILGQSPGVAPTAAIGDSNAKTVNEIGFLYLFYCL